MAEGKSLISSLINAAEKASNIARVCRSNTHLLKLLIQEKIGNEANNVRFEHDFKTLADVLIQETIKHDVGQLFPSMRDSIRGEESPSFTNTLGESVTITIGETMEDTSRCLASVLNGNEAAANALADEVHRSVVHKISTEKIPDLPEDFDYARLGVWIDPIDGTAEYIRGGNEPTQVPEISTNGLLCATVLIGVYDKDTAEPIIGVISQPFHFSITDEDDFYHSRIIWGIALPNLMANNCEVPLSKQEPNEIHHRAILSSSERAVIFNILNQLEYQHVTSAGAGYKALQLILGTADVYVLSLPSTFKWDTCAPQAILRSMGSNMYDLKASIKNAKPIPLAYPTVDENGENEKCNTGGLLAIRDGVFLQPLLERLAAISW